MFVILRYFCGFFASAGSATIYAYLGEFHDSKTRTRSVMGASIVFGFGCMALPLLALICLNQEWQFFVPVFNIMYKPWRFFLVVCTLPSMFCAFALYKLPESPKYKYSKGHHDVTVMILRKVYAFNTGKAPETFPVTQIVDESETVKKKRVDTSDCVDENNNETSNGKSLLRLCHKVIDQTFPLFKPPYLNRTLIACILQFGIFVTSNGMYMIFPDILNRIADYTSKAGNGTESKTLCQIVEYTTFDVGLLENNSSAMVSFLY